MGYERRMEAGKSNSQKKVRDGRVEEEEDQIKKRKIWSTREKVRIFGRGLGREME